MVIVIQNTISKFPKTKIQTQKRPLKLKKIKNIYKEALNKKVLLNRPPKSGIFIQNTIYKFSKTKNQI